MLFFETMRATRVQMRLLPFRPTCTAPESRQLTLQDHQVGRLGNISSILTLDFASLDTELGLKSRVQADLEAKHALRTGVVNQSQPKILLYISMSIP